MDSEETLVLNITPTEEVVVIDGVEYRAWRGATIDGHRCTVFVFRVGCNEWSPLVPRLERALKERSIVQDPPAAADAIMRRLGL